MHELHSFTLRGDTIEAGAASGMPVLLPKPLSFWGGYDAAAGCIIEAAHPNAGQSLAGAVMLMAAAKGSSSSSSVLAEAIRAGTGPAAIVMRERDLIIALGVIVARELYGMAVPLVVVDEAAWQTLAACRSRIHIAASDKGAATISFSPDSP